MPSCLGLYIEDNIIKYAKVSKDHDNIKVESYGVKFYDNIDDTVKQIISETYSYKNPISVNLPDEKYAYANLFNLLSKKDLQKAIDTEFDYFCEENHKNRQALEYKSITVPNLQDKDKVKSLYVYSDKASIAGRNQILDGYKLTNINPLPISIVNLYNFNDKTNSVIVNIEKNTSVTFIVNGQIQKVEIIENGMKDILENIIKKENSYAKAYEICKNTTIYTAQGRNLQIEENEYMEDIMPALYNIVEKVKEIIKDSEDEVKNIYISGLATAINNIDLYFQENFLDKKCEILAPFFVKKENIKLNIKDYIEVNSAISLALNGVGVGYKEINFKNKSAFNQMSQLLNTEIGGKNNKSNTKKVSNKKQKNYTNILKFDFNEALDVIEKNMIRFGVGLLFLIVLYTVFSNIIMNQIKNKDKEVLEYIGDSEAKIAKITSNTKLINERKQQYVSLIEKMDQESDKIVQSYARKNALPNFLTQIMYNIPKEVQLISIENYTEKGIKIQAKSKEYEQLGYFIAKIKTEGILNGVTATSGEKQDDFVVITIEGNLPY